MIKTYVTVHEVIHFYSQGNLLGFFSKVILDLVQVGYTLQKLSNRFGNYTSYIYQISTVFATSIDELESKYL